MEFKLHPLILATTILSLSSVNGQQVVVQPGYEYYSQPGYNYYYDQPIQPYFYPSTLRQNAESITSEPNIIQQPEQMDKEQQLLHQKVIQQLNQRFNNITPSSHEVQSQGQPSHIIITSPSSTNIQPLAYSGPYGSNAFILGGIENVDQNGAYYEIGRTHQTRSVGSECNTYCENTNVSPASTVKSSSPVKDLRQGYNGANNNKQGEKKDQDYSTIEFSPQVLKSVKSEIVNLLSSMSNSGSNLMKNISLDTADLQKFLQKFVPLARNISRTAGINLSGYNRTQNTGNQDLFSLIDSTARQLNNGGGQPINPPRPSAPIPQNYGNNGWNSRNNDLSSQGWWINSYNNLKPGYSNNNAPPMNNNGQLANFKYNAQSTNPERPGEYSNYEQSVNSNYNTQSLNSGRPREFYSNVPFVNPGKTVITNPNVQNSPNNGFNPVPYNNYGMYSNFPPGYSTINAGYQSGPEPRSGNSNVKYSQGQQNSNM